MNNNHTKIDAIDINDFKIDFRPPSIHYKRIYLKREDFPLTIIGNNGSGKSSLTLTLCGIIPKYITANIINYKFIVERNKIFYSINNNDIIRIIPQRLNYGLLGFTPQDEINLIKNNNNKWKKKLEEIFKINEINRIPSAYLSDGEKKRLIICAALVSEAPLIIADEWMTHLDNNWIHIISNVLKSYQNNGGLFLSFASSNKDCFEKTFNLSTKISPEKFGFNYNKINDSCIIESIQKIMNSYSHVCIEFSSVINYKINNKKKQLKINAKPGDLIAFIGPNGSGKTTIIRKLWSKTNSIFKRKYYNIRSRECIKETLTISSNPIYQLTGPTIRDEIDRNFKKNKLDIYNIISCITDVDSDVLSLSFGQRKIIVITLFLLSNSQIISIDEPYTGLDEENIFYVSQLFKIAKTVGKIIIISSQHDNNQDVTQKIYLHN